MALFIHLISLILISPIVGALLVYLLPLKNRDTKIVAVVMSIIPLILSTILMLGVLTDFVDLTQEGEFFAVEKAEWIPQVGINYHLGADALSAVLVFLTSLLVTLALIHSWDETHRHREFNAMLLFMQTTIIGVFVSLDSFLFFLFWEAGLVPMYFLIAIWGGPNKKYAAIKFFLFTQAASLLVLIGIFAFYFSSDPHTFSMVAFIENNPIGAASQDLLFIAMMFGFGTKLPMVPVHTWLPDAHGSAYRWVRTARRCPAENGRLWSHKVQRPDVRFGVRLGLGVIWGHRRHKHGVRCIRLSCSGRFEKDDRILKHQPHGHRDVGDLDLGFGWKPDWNGRCDIPVVCTWSDLSRIVHDCRFCWTQPWN
jgi:hypothetical protein